MMWMRLPMRSKAGTRVDLTHFWHGFRRDPKLKEIVEDLNAELAAHLSNRGILNDV